jgi:hypothetical protein
MSLNEWLQDKSEDKNRQRQKRKESSEGTGLQQDCC